MHTWSDPTTSASAAHILEECDTGSDGKVSKNSMHHSCWAVLAEKEGPT